MYERQWETTLQCNTVSHWLGVSAERSLRACNAESISMSWLQHALCQYFQVIKVLMQFSTMDKSGDQSSTTTGIPRTTLEINQEIGHTSCKLLTLYMLNFSEVITFYVIPPHWHNTGSWNPSWHKTRTFFFYIVNIIGADVLATQGARASAAVIFTMLNQINSNPAR